MAQFGEILADLRKDKNLSQNELGNILHVAGSTISSYERGVSLPNSERIIQISEFFSVPTDYLLGKTQINVHLELLSEYVTETMTVQDVINLIMALPRDRREAITLLLIDIQTGVSGKHSADISSKAR